MKTIMYSAILVLIATAIKYTVEDPKKEPIQLDKKEKELDSLIDISIKYESKIDDNFKTILFSKESEIDSLKHVIKKKDMKLKSK